MSQPPLFLDPHEAARLIRSGATIAVCGSAQVGVPESILRALGQRYLDCGEPRDLTLYCPVESGDRRGVGLDHLAQPGMLRRMVAGAFIFTGTRDQAESTRMVLENEIEAYNLPMGVMYHLLREIAAGRPGLITDVGLGTFVEPDRGGAKLNTRTRDDIVEYHDVDGRRYLRYKPMPIDVALIRGTTADEHGNISMEAEASLQGMLVMAQAAKASGGRVIAQVQRLACAGSLNPQAIRVPGGLVDVVVVDSAQEQLMGQPYNPALSGELRAPTQAASFIDLPLAAKVIALRAAAELPANGVVNLGFGLSAFIPSVLQQINPRHGITFFVEQGAAGGVALPGMGFGASTNPASLIDMPSWFDFLDSGAFDATCLGWGEVDGVGSIRNHRVGNVLSGCGGFIDITVRVPRIIFCGTFSSGGLDVAFKDDKLLIKREGRHQKFREEEMTAPTLNGPLTRLRGQEVTLITERAVFQVGTAGLRLDELAPGISLDELRDAIPFDIEVSRDLRPMDRHLFASSDARIASMS